MSNILIVDDERDIRELIGDILNDEGFETRLASNSEECLSQLSSSLPSLIILDIWLNDSQMDGIDILKYVKNNYPDVPVIIISGHGNVEIAVAAIKQGAYDFIEKPFNIDQLLVVISRAMETALLRKENTALKRPDKTEPELIGNSPIFKTFKSQLSKVFKTNSRVLLTGPSGSGKELAARYIHENSSRSDYPFCTISPSTIDYNLIDEFLFGKESDDKIETGAFEKNNRGTIYFDEIVELPIETQAKLIRLLVNQEFTRMGGSEKISVDLRIISSSSHNLDAAIQNGKLKKELYHRINVMPIAVPDLGQRREDIPELAAYFIEQLHREQGLSKREFSPDALGVLQTMSWPGNIRQLRNIIERVLILGDENKPIAADELPVEKPNSNKPNSQFLPPSIANLPLREARELFEREYLISQIERFGGNISRTAAFIGMERSALHRKLKSLNLTTTQKQATLAEKEVL